MNRESLRIEESVRYSVSEVKMDAYDQSLTDYLKGKNMAVDDKGETMSELFWFYQNLQVILSLAQKQIDKHCSQLVEIERKVELNNYYGNVNGLLVVSLTALKVAFDLCNLYSVVNPKAFGRVHEVMDKWSGKKATDLSLAAVLNPANAEVNPTVQLSPVKKTAAELAEEAQKYNAKCQKTFETLSNITGSGLQLAMNREQAIQKMHLAQEESLKYQKNQSLDPAVNQDDAAQQQAIQSLIEAEKRRSETNTALAR